MIEEYIKRLKSQKESPTEFSGDYLTDYAKGRRFNAKVANQAGDRIKELLKDKKIEGKIQLDFNAKYQYPYLKISGPSSGDRDLVDAEDAMFDVEDILREYYSGVSFEEVSDSNEEFIFIFDFQE